MLECVDKFALGNRAERQCHREGSVHRGVGWKKGDRAALDGQPGQLSLHERRACIPCPVSDKVVGSHA